ncbi:hypothetical protein [Ancylobacter oerskovii]|uniref:HNH endonuclease n=1 Tax=Ancylobacter oerskovii TaxID=459519 RepID=A0ABW4YRV0_9HYPH|nr:hypothetical protein [Ancylobacter oerskovii]MBS7545669.1 hypothetical protein [Ancylobacter oerskovii]
MTPRLTPEQLEERRAHGARATERAKAIVKPGDVLQFTRCGGVRSRATFIGWEGQWMCSTSLSDIHALHVFKLNGDWVSFADEGNPDPAVGDVRLDAKVMAFHPFFPDETDTTLLADRMVFARAPHRCAICLGDVLRGERHRARTERINEGAGRVMTFRFCRLCCEAMAASWTDEGKAITERTAIGIAASRAEVST